MSISPELDIIDRAIQRQYCETGNIADLDPGAFTPKDHEKALSFSDRNQKSPAELLEELNAGSDYYLQQTPEKQRKINVDWVIGLKATVVEQDPCITDVLLDGLNDNPAHVSGFFEEHLTGEDKDGMGRRLAADARAAGFAAERETSA